jgi:hypothetical protein
MPRNHRTAVTAEAGHNSVGGGSPRLVTVVLDPGPNWADIMTALDTVGATVVALIAAGLAVLIALWS